VASNPQSTLKFGFTDESVRNGVASWAYARVAIDGTIDIKKAVSTSTRTIVGFGYSGSIR
jgi:hypothetical protein